MQYWLMKSEPDAYSIEDLEKEGRSCWDGIRNYQARNFMRDEMKIGDLVLFYHSNVKPPGVVGVAKVCSGPYPDHTAWDSKQKYYDPKSSEAKPIWEMVDIEFVRRLPRKVSLDEIRQHGELEKMLLIKKGMRLSIQPVSRAEFDFICSLADQAAAC